MGEVDDGGGNTTADNVSQIILKDLFPGVPHRARHPESRRG
jgi:hypothetical protein